MAGWFEDLLDRFRWPPSRRPSSAHGDTTMNSFAAFDHSGSSSSGSDDRPDAPNVDETSSFDSAFDSAFDGGESGGGGASADYGGGGDGGGGDGGGGGGGD